MRPLVAELCYIRDLFRALKHSEAWSIVRSCKVLGYTTIHSYIVTLIPRFSLQDVCYSFLHQTCSLFSSEGSCEKEIYFAIYSACWGLRWRPPEATKEDLNLFLKITIILHYASLTKRFVKRVH